MLVLPAAAQGAVYLAFLVALSGVRISKARHVVRLATFDAAAMAVASFVLWPSPVVAYVLWGTAPALVTGALALTSWLGFRVTISATATNACVSRRILFVVPWSQRCHRGAAHAFTDGWGDFADPEALEIGFAGGGPAFELGWGGRDSGTRCEDLATVFNAEVSALRARPP